MFLLKKLLRLGKIQIMIKECNQYAHETSKDLVCKKEEIKFNNTMKPYKVV